MHGVRAQVVLGLLAAAESIGAHPSYAAYFAPIAGGRARGHYHLLGDSCDQGQDLPRLAAWLARHALPGEVGYLAYCGEDSPAARGLHMRRLPSLPNPRCAAAAEPYDAAPPRPWGADDDDDDDEEQRLTASERASLALLRRQAAHAVSAQESARRTAATAAAEAAQQAARAAAFGGVR